MHGASSSAAANVSLETRETATALLTEGPQWPGRDGVVSGRVFTWCWWQQNSEDEAVSLNTTCRKVAAWPRALAPQISCCTSSTRCHVTRCSSWPRDVKSRDLYKLVETWMGEKFIRSLRGEGSNMLVRNTDGSGARALPFWGPGACVWGGNVGFLHVLSCDYFIHVCMSCFKM